MNEKQYKQVQYINPNDNRSFDEKFKTLPFVREEDLEEWKNWWEGSMNLRNEANANNQYFKTNKR
jgi:hypothetical protein